MRNPDRRDSLPGMLRDTSVRLGYQERVVHRGTGGGVVAETEVEISPTDPIPFNPAAELWFDPDAPTPPGGGTATSEVEVSTVEPTNPDAELWFDPDAATDPFQSINEVWIGDTAPTDGNVELWFNPSATLP